MTRRQAEIAVEIRALAARDLGLSFSLGDDEELAGRLDSLALLSLVVAVEDRFRVKITEEDGAGARTLADLARLVERLATSEAAREPRPPSPRREDAVREPEPGRGVGGEGPPTEPRT